MTKRKMILRWILLALLAAILAAPNASIIKFNVGITDPLFYNVLRYSFVVVACMILLVGRYHKLSGEGVRHAMVAGIAMAIAVTFYVLAIEASQASYVAILTLITPIIFVLVSSITLKEKIKHKTLAGMTLAMLGALVVVIGPIALSQGGSLTIYPLATFYMLINSITFSISMVWMRRANEAKLPMVGVVGIQASMILIIASGLMLAFGDWNRTELTPTLIGSALYSGIILTLVVRSIDTLVYEKVGSATIGGMGYIETFLAILFPVIVLGEKLSLAMVLGGILILFGMYIIERRKIHKHRHLLHLHRHH